MVYGPTVRSVLPISEVKKRTNTFQMTATQLPSFDPINQRAEFMPQTESYDLFKEEFAPVNGIDTRGYEIDWLDDEVDEIVEPSCYDSESGVRKLSQNEFAPIDEVYMDKLFSNEADTRKYGL